MSVKNNSHVLKKGGKNLNFENWKVYHPNGKHMFTCGEKKASWYLERGLATIINEFSIQLNFNPKGSGFHDNEEFGRHERQPICVVSGSYDELQRHHIVPYCYRSYFTDEYKSKNHHDVVLINQHKHAEYEVFANIFKDEIAKIYGIKTIAELNYEYSMIIREFNSKRSYVLSLLHSLFVSYDKIPYKLIKDKLQITSNELKIDYDFLCNLNYIQLYKLYVILKKKYNDEYIEFKEKYRLEYDHGYQLVNLLDSDEKITEFIKLWRKHFIKYAKPKYMPQGWSINFRVKTNL